MPRQPLSFGLILATALLGASGGCATVDPLATATVENSDEPTPRQAVPDAIMLRDQAGSFYRDTPIP